jgi:hypothetical protein
MPSLRSKVKKDDIAGGLMVALGLATNFVARSYDVGTLEEIGPGFFPKTVGVGLVLVGLVIILLQRFAAGAQGCDAVEADLGVAFSRASLRGWICILSAMTAFVPIARHFGLLPASLAIVFISALGDRHNTLLSAVILSLTLMVVCAVVFWWALSLQIPLFLWSLT